METNRVIEQIIRDLPDHRRYKPQHFANIAAIVELWRSENDRWVINYWRHDDGRAWVQVEDNTSQASPPVNGITRYDDDTIAFDDPWALPKYVKAAAHRVLHAAVKA